VTEGVVAELAAAALPEEPRILACAEPAVLLLCLQSQEGAGEAEGWNL
jgi:hypothetical protein